MIHFLGAIGLTLTVVLSRIASPIRNIFRPLFGCSMCFGFWVGLGVGFFLVYPEMGAGMRIVESILYGFSVSIVSYVTYAVIEKLGAP